MTAAKRTYQDFKVPPGVHTWRVRSRDEEGLSATSGPVSATVRKAAPSRARVLGLRMVGGGSGAARYSLKARGRLLVDLRVIGTVKKPRLRIWVAERPRPGDGLARDARLVVAAPAARLVARPPRLRHDQASTARSTRAAAGSC